MRSTSTSKAECAAFENYLTDVFTKAFGDPIPCGFDDGHKWTFPVLGGVIQFTLPRPSRTLGRERRSRTIFARYVGPAEYNPFGISHKNNLHCLSTWTKQAAINTAIRHVRNMTYPGTPARRAMDDAPMIVGENTKAA